MVGFRYSFFLIFIYLAALGSIIVACRHAGSLVVACELLIAACGIQCSDQRLRPGPHIESGIYVYLYPLASAFCLPHIFTVTLFFFHSCVLTYSKLFSLLFWCFFLVAALETKVFILNVLFHFEFIVDRFKEDIRTL